MADQSVCWRGPTGREEVSEPGEVPLHLGLAMEVGRQAVRLARVHHELARHAEILVQRSIQSARVHRRNSRVVAADVDQGRRRDRSETVERRRLPVGLGVLPGQGAVAHAKATTPDNAIYIPAAAHASGALNTNWRTDVQLHNPGTVQSRVNVDMLVRDQANPSPQTRTFTINAGTSVRLQDILASSFSFDGAAALRISILQGDVVAIRDRKSVV